MLTYTAAPAFAEDSVIDVNQSNNEVTQTFDGGTTEVVTDATSITNTANSELVINFSNLPDGVLNLSELTNRGTIYGIATTDSGLSAGTISANNINNLGNGIITTVLPQGVTSIGGFDVSALMANFSLILNVTQALVNNGIIASANNLTINGTTPTATITNNANGIIAAVNNINLNAANITNLGAIIAGVNASSMTNSALASLRQGNIMDNIRNLGPLNGNVAFSNIFGTNVLSSVLNVIGKNDNNRNGVIAGNDINFTALNNEGAADISVLGGRLISNTVQFNGGNSTSNAGTVTVDVHRISGDVNAYGRSAIVGAQNGAVSIASVNIADQSSEPGFAALISHDNLLIDFTGLSGEDVNWNFLAGKNVIATNNSAATTLNAGQGGISINSGKDVFYGATPGGNVNYGWFGSSESGGNVRLSDVNLLTDGGNVWISADRGNSFDGNVNVGNITTSSAASESEGGSVNITAGGRVNVGNITTNGANGGGFDEDSGPSGRGAGNIFIETSGNIVTGALTALGGNAVSGGFFGNRQGGNGGNIDLSAGGSLRVDGAILSIGGNGADGGSFFGRKGGGALDGGEGGCINISADRNIVLNGNVISQGGQGGNGANAELSQFPVEGDNEYPWWLFFSTNGGNGGSGGNSGNISITSEYGQVTLNGCVGTAGGAGGNGGNGAGLFEGRGNGGSGGIGGDAGGIAISAATSLTGNDKIQSFGGNGGSGGDGGGGGLFGGYGGFAGVEGNEREGRGLDEEGGGSNTGRSGGNSGGIYLSANTITLNKIVETLGGNAGNGGDGGTAIYGGDGAGSGAAGSGGNISISARGNISAANVLSFGGNGGNGGAGGIGQFQSGSGADSGTWLNVACGERFLSGGDGGNISITSENGEIKLEVVQTAGGNGGAEGNAGNGPASDGESGGGRGGNGGRAGNITVASFGGFGDEFLGLYGGSITANNIFSFGGNGGSGGNGASSIYSGGSGGNGGDGGRSGNVNLLTGIFGSVTVNDVFTVGGNGGSGGNGGTSNGEYEARGGNGGDGGDAGNGGRINITQIPEIALDGEGRSILRGLVASASGAGGGGIFDSDFEDVGFLPFLFFEGLEFFPGLPDSEDLPKLSAQNIASMGGNGGNGGLGGFALNASGSGGAGGRGGNGKDVFLVSLFGPISVSETVQSSGGNGGNAAASGAGACFTADGGRGGNAGDIFAGSLFGGLELSNVLSIGGAGGHGGNALETSYSGNDGGKGGRGGNAGDIYLGTLIGSVSANNVMSIGGNGGNGGAGGDGIYESGRGGAGGRGGSAGSLYLFGGIPLFAFDDEESELPAGITIGGTLQTQGGNGGNGGAGGSISGENEGDAGRGGKGGDGGAGGGIYASSLTGIQLNNVLTFGGNGGNGGDGGTGFFGDARGGRGGDGGCAGPIKLNSFEIVLNGPVQTLAGAGGQGGSPNGRDGEDGYAKGICVNAEIVEGSENILEPGVRGEGTLSPFAPIGLLTAPLKLAPDLLFCCNEPTPNGGNIVLTVDTTPPANTPNGPFNNDPGPSISIKLPDIFFGGTMLPSDLTRDRGPKSIDDPNQLDVQRLEEIATDDQQSWVIATNLKQPYAFMDDDGTLIVATPGSIFAVTGDRQITLKQGSLVVLSGNTGVDILTELGTVSVPPNSTGGVHSLFGSTDIAHLFGKAMTFALSHSGQTERLEVALDQHLKVFPTQVATAGASDYVADPSTLVSPVPGISTVGGEVDSKPFFAMLKGLDTSGLPTEMLDRLNEVINNMIAHNSELSGKQKASNPAPLYRAAAGNIYVPVSFPTSTPNVTTSGSDVQAMSIDTASLRYSDATAISTDSKGNVTLSKGDLLVETTKPMVVTAADTRIGLDRRVVALITNNKGIVKVKNLYENTSDAILVKAGGTSALLHAGQELVSAVNEDLSHAEMRADRVARRRVESVKTKSGHVVFGDFSIASAIRHDRLLTNIFRSKHTNDQKMAARLMKMYAALITVTANKGAYTQVSSAK